MARTRHFLYTLLYAVFLSQINNKMKVIAKVTMFKNKGSAYEKEIFTKGREYVYCAESSTWQNKLVEPNEGTGQYSIFNEEDFVKYFSLK